MSFRHCVSRAFGAFARHKFAKPIQALINNCYAKAFDIDMREFLRPSQYPSLNALFTRKLELGRKFEGKSAFISPSDGKILALGASSDGLAISVKGHTYSVSELLFDYEIGDFEYANIYLSPRDYHRFHAPFDMRILSAFYVPGALYSVSKSALERRPNLYAKNERVILECLLPNNTKIFMVFIGAINVAKMSFSFDKNIQTNAKNGSATRFHYDRVFVKKGEDLGCFELGSSIVLLSEGGVRFSAVQDQTVRFGDTIGQILD